MLYVFLQCSRLRSVFELLRFLCDTLGEDSSVQTFILGPFAVLVNFLFGQAKLAIWLTRKNKLKGGVQVDIGVSLAKGP